jgi:hypothetical protein
MTPCASLRDIRWKKAAHPKGTSRRRGKNPQSCEGSDHCAGQAAEFCPPILLNIGPRFKTSKATSTSKPASPASRAAATRSRRQTVPNSVSMEKSPDVSPQPGALGIRYNDLSSNEPREGFRAYSNKHLLHDGNGRVSGVDDAAPDSDHDGMCAILGGQLG